MNQAAPSSRWLLAAAWFAAWPSAAGATEVYRCTALNGAVQYQAVPCEGGRPVLASDERTVEQRQQAEQRLQRLKQVPAAEGRPAHSATAQAPAPAQATVIGQRPTMDSAPASAARRKPPRIIKRKGPPSAPTAHAAGQVPPPRPAQRP